MNYSYICKPSSVGNKMRIFEECPSRFLPWNYNEWVLGLSRTKGTQKHKSGPYDFLWHIPCLCVRNRLKFCSFSNLWEKQCPICAWIIHTRSTDSLKRLKRTIRSWIVHRFFFHKFSWSFDGCQSFLDELLFLILWRLWITNGAKLNHFEQVIIWAPT